MPLEYRPSNPQGGIDFSVAYRAYDEDEEISTIVGASGNEFELEVAGNRLTVRDKKYPEDRLLSAIVVASGNESGLFFVLQKEKSPMDHGEVELPWDRHPDLNGKGFIGVAYDFFESIGRDITFLRGVWFSTSKNQAEYLSNRAAGMNKANSARNTWTGRTYGQYGFTEVRGKDVIQWRDEGKLVIEVDFRRPRLPLPA